MEKKITVITESGISIRVAEHMLDDLIKFGVTRTSPKLKEVPKEILNLKTKINPKINLPPMEQVKTELPIEVVTEIKVKESPMEPIKTELVKEVVFDKPKTRKTPVRSKSKK